MTPSKLAGLLAACAPELERLLNRAHLPPPQFSVPDIRIETRWVAMRDGVRLATDLYLPPIVPAPVVVVRTPYGRNIDDSGFVGSLLSLARRGYVVVSQDCRGTGESEPDSWDYYMYEVDDSYDFIEWLRLQEWCGGFIGALGSSYVGQMQWCMATHPAMSTIVPNMSGLGVASNTASLYMFHNAYARSVGKGQDKVAVPYYEMERLILDETLAGGYFNEPLGASFSDALLARFPRLKELSQSAAQRWIWEQYCGMSCAQRAEFVKEALGVRQVTSEDIEALPSVFGRRISHDALTIPHAEPAELCRMIHAVPLIRTGWYDWCLNDALATWEMLRQEAHADVAAGARLVITPYAHNVPGYHEGAETHPELMAQQSTLNMLPLLLDWYAAVRSGAIGDWPKVIYYLMGANEWHVARDWPVPGAQPVAFYLGASGTLTSEPPSQDAEPDRYSYDPRDPTPTVGGSIVSYVYPPGSVDVSAAQRRRDVLVFTTPTLEADLDIVGPLRMILYASSTAVDTDFVVRLSDTFPDGRAIQLQSGILRARHRGPGAEPSLLHPGAIHRFEIDLWATANRFRAGHRLRIDISSADFPHFDRNSNRGGQSGEPLVAHQAVHHDPRHPSHLLAYSLESTPR